MGILLPVHRITIPLALNACAFAQNSFPPFAFSDTKALKSSIAIWLPGSPAYMGTYIPDAKINSKVIKDFKAALQRQC